MAFTWNANSHRLSTRECKVLSVRMLNGDVINTTTTLAFAGTSLPVLDTTPIEYFAVDITPGAANLVTATLSIEGFTTAANGTCTGVIFTKTSVNGGAMNREFLVYLKTRPFYA